MMRLRCKVLVLGCSPGVTAKYFPLEAAGSGNRHCVQIVSRVGADGLVDQFMHTHVLSTHPIDREKMYV